MTPTISDLQEMKTYLEHALDEMTELEGNPNEAQAFIKDALSVIRRYESQKEVKNL